MPAVPALIAGGAAVIGGVLASRAQTKAANSAANASMYNADRAAQAQMDMFNQARDDMFNQRSLFDVHAFQQLVKELNTNVGDSNQMGKYLSELTNVGNNQPAAPTFQSSLGRSVNGPLLRSDVDINLEADPIYQAQKNELLKTLNMRSAAQGKLNSSDADNAIVRNLSPLMMDSYGRNLSELERENQNSLADYGFRVDDYNRNLADLERANQNALLGYNVGVDQYTRNTANVMDRANLDTLIRNFDYNQLLDAAKIGSGAAATAGGWGMQAGSNLASTYNNLGNNLATINLQRGQSTADSINNAIGGALGAYNNYNLMNAINPNYGQQSYGNTGYSNYQWMAPTEYRKTDSPRY